MYFKIFLPFLILLIIQILGFILYNGFSFDPLEKTKYLVISTYFFTIVFIFFIGIFYNINNRIVLEEKNGFNKTLGFIIIFLVLCFLNKPSIILFFLGQSLGVDYVRDNFFVMESLRIQVFGNATIAAFTLMYVAPILWFFCIYLIGRSDKFSKFLFYYILFSLVVFNISYAGRFYIYFAFLVLYLKAILEGDSFLGFLKKYSIVIFSFLFFSFLILSLRNGDSYDSDIGKELNTLVEYHLVQPFFWSQKIDTGYFLFDGYPFKLFTESLFFPLFYLVGKSFSDISYGFYANKFSDFTLYSNQTGNTYNAFSTMYAYLFSDFGYFTPIFSIFFIILIMFFSFFIRSSSDRLKYISYFSLMLYFSLFQAPIFSPGCLLVLFLVPFFLRYRFKI